MKPDSITKGRLLSQRVDKVKERLVNKILFIGSIFGLIALISAILTEEVYLWSLDFFADVLIISVLSISHIFRKRLHIKTKLGIVITLLFVLFITDTYQFGVLSTDKLLLALIPFFSILVYSVRTTALIVILEIILYLVVSYFISIEILTTVTYNESNFDYGNWINFALMIAIVGLLTTMFIFNYEKVTKQFIEHLSDTTEELRKRDVQLNEHLEEKNVMLQEIHHRVKNNLAVVSGLIDLQAREIEDKDLKSALEKSKNRVLSIAKVHQMLYQSEDFNKIPLKKFIEELAELVLSTMTIGDKEITVTSNIESKYLNVNFGVPVGIIINELITNSAKYAFSNSTDNQIQINVSESEHNIHVTYSDNGIGIYNFEEAATKSLGFTLIISLLDQLEATYSFATHDEFKLSFSFKAQQ